MSFKISEPLFNIGNISFSALRFGTTDQFISVLSTAPDGRSWVISPCHAKLTYSLVEKEAVNLCNKAIYMAACKAAPNYFHEVLAYVKNLPNGRRSNYLNSLDKELQNEAETDIQIALEHALMHRDTFRAAVEFETRVPYLISDRYLINSMDEIIPDFRRKYTEEEWIILASEKTEENLRKMHPFLDTQISSWRNTFIHCDKTHI